jgi:hypothetical protein
MMNRFFIWNPVLSAAIVTAAAALIGMTLNIVVVVAVSAFIGGMAGEYWLAYRQRALIARRSVADAEICYQRWQPLHDPEIDDDAADRIRNFFVIRRYFVFDDAGASYFVVATDIYHARAVLSAAGCEFGDHGKRGPRPLAEAEADGDVTWKEIDASEAFRKRCCTDDGRGTIPLTQADLGDWFCTEY